jgi:hypothetical protein
VYVDHYYFDIDDADFGPLFVKVRVSAGALEHRTPSKPRARRRFRQR